MRAGLKGRLAAAVVIVAATIPLQGCGGLEPGSVAPEAIADPTTTARPESPNSALVCPERACAAVADRMAPRYATSPEALFAAWRATVADTPRAAIVAEDPARLLLLVQQRSAVFRFVDTVVVRVLPIEDGGSSFAALSRSEFGYDDFGVNETRLAAWQAEAERRLDLAATAAPRPPAR